MHRMARSRSRRSTSLAAAVFFYVFSYYNYVSRSRRSTSVAAAVFFYSMCPHTTTMCVIMLLYMCPNTIIHVS